jgi:hypothetical protein
MAVCFFHRCDLSDIPSIAQSVRDSIQFDDPGFFDDEDGSHLWVFGFSDGSNCPEFCQVDRNGVLDLLEGEALPFRTCTRAGAHFLSSWEWQNHDEAFQYACKEQGERGKPEFGGRLHQLHVTPAGCGWTSSHEPLRGTLGLEMTLGKWKATTFTSKEDLSNPRCRILSLRKTLVDNLCRRAVVAESRRPTTYGGAKEHWKALSKPNWDLTDQLIAAHDDADLASPADVSPDDAQCYADRVQQIVDSLPPEVRLGG